MGQYSSNSPYNMGHLAHSPFQVFCPRVHSIPKRAGNSGARNAFLDSHSVAIRLFYRGGYLRGAAPKPLIEELFRYRELPRSLVSKSLPPRAVRAILYRDDARSLGGPNSETIPGIRTISNLSELPRVRCRSHGDVESVCSLVSLGRFFVFWASIRRGNPSRRGKENRKKPARQLNGRAFWSPRRVFGGNVRPPRHVPQGSTEPAESIGALK